ncbi:uncharacterized protein LOC108032233 [Drosophila biarmipes]|uniref:uncharacterized protein LOC108032233 n=1 Tax=Drosophila biarmipes TaxID=125945 RepID=UPI0007E77E35|nr:uncharacterized protein LOC108032233 [Drosophila biarmipes]
MIKYLAGIFAKSRNDYVDGRLTTPLTRKMASIRDPQPRISLKTTPCKLQGNPKESRPNSRSPRKFNHVQVEPVSYIVDVSDSSSSLDEVDAIHQLPGIPKVLGDRVSNKEFRADAGELLPIPPPVSRVQSWTGPFNANPFNKNDDLSTWRRTSNDGGEHPLDWELDWLPEEFWSADQEPENISK